MNSLATHIGFAILAIATWSAVLARVYVRYCIVSSMAMGDWLIVITTMCLTAIIALAWRLVNLGMGQHQNTLDPATVDVVVSELRKLFYFNEILYAISTITLKLSIAMLLLSFCLQPIPRRIVLWTTIAYVLYGIIFLFVIIFQCVPVSALWTRDADAKCIATSVIDILIYFHASVSLLTDGIFALLPIWLVSQIQMSMRTKISVCGVLGLGLTTAAVNISRFFFINELFDPSDISYHFYAIGITSLLEIGIGIIAASMATLRPLLRLFWQKVGCSSSSAPKAKTSDVYTQSTHDYYSGGSVLAPPSATHLKSPTLVVEQTAGDRRRHEEDEEPWDWNQASEVLDITKLYPTSLELEAILAKYERKQAEPV